MKTSKLLLCLVAVGTAFASAASRYSIHLNQTVTVSGTELKAGDYKLEINGDKAMITGGKQSVEATVKVEENGEKYQATTVRILAADGKNKLSEIHLRGTKSKVLFN